MPIASFIPRFACVMLLSMGLPTYHASAQSPPPPSTTPDDAAAIRVRHLDALFAHLKTTTVEEEGDAMVAEIWKLWLQSGRPEIDTLMEQAISMMNSGLAAQALPVLDDVVAR